MPCLKIRLKKPVLEDRFDSHPCLSVVVLLQHCIFRLGWKIDDQNPFFPSYTFHIYKLTDCYDIFGCQVIRVPKSCVDKVLG